MPVVQSVVLRHEQGDLLSTSTWEASSRAQSGRIQVLKGKRLQRICQSQLLQNHSVSKH